MRYILSALVVSCCVLFPAMQIGFASDRQEIIVSAAISLKNAFEEIGNVFEGKNRGTKVNFNFGASGDLARQIVAGAPVDVFASAALKDMDDLNRQGLITPGSGKSGPQQSRQLQDRLLLRLLQPKGRGYLKNMGSGFSDSDHHPGR